METLFLKGRERCWLRNDLNHRKRIFLTENKDPKNPIRKIWTEVLFKGSYDMFQLLHRMVCKITQFI